MSCSCGSSQQRIQLALAVQCVNPVAVADMASVDEDLRHGPASVRPFAHLAPPRRLGIPVDLLEGDALPFEQIGRASFRGRVFPHGYISVASVPIKTKS